MVSVPVLVKSATVLKAAPFRKLRLPPFAARLLRLRKTAFGPTTATVPLLTVSGAPRFRMRVVESRAVRVRTPLLVNPPAPRVIVPPVHWLEPAMVTAPSPLKLPLARLRPLEIVSERLTVSVPFQLASMVSPAIRPPKAGSTTAVRLVPAPLEKRTLSLAPGTTPAAQLAGLLQLVAFPGAPPFQI